ncbi:unnamed protein product [Effrenium voratum]|nr:unnamed protein product [Effrenium voratum]
METDMASILRSPHRLSDEHCQFFLYQILRGLKYVHSAGLVHGSLKPRILLVNSNCDLKISDFWVYRPPEERVCNRWYVAPEVLCSLEAGAAIDMWALGLIFAEMVTRKPLLPGNSVVHQLQLIIRLIGFPEADILSRINEKPRRFMESLPKICGPALYEALRPYEAVASVMELLDSLLQFDPDHRLNAEQALALPYFEQLHCPQDEPSSSPIDPNDFEFERRKIDLVALREEIFLEALHYHPDVQRRYLQELAEYGTSYDITKYRLLAPDEPHYDD